MKKLLFITGFCLLGTVLAAQTVSSGLQKAFQQFEADPQLSHAISSLYVIDAKTGRVVFDRNSQVGLAPASTQKVITSVTAFELLGKEYRFKTNIGYDIGIANGELQGNLYIEGFGDPTLGSWRWKSTTADTVLKRITGILRQRGIQRIAGDIWLDDMQLGPQPVPDGWIWQDIGNYYGAGCWGINWNENQYNLVLEPGKIKGHPAEIIATKPVLAGYEIGNMIRTGAAGSGDNAYIYYAPYSNRGFATGTVPAGEKSFTISGSLPHPAKQFANALAMQLKKENIPFGNKLKFYTDSAFANEGVRKAAFFLDSIMSPALDTINYWFLQKSINLYGEALIRQLGRAKLDNGSTEAGIGILRDFWKQKGIDDNELNISDGSGLSPQNRVTAHAQVEILKYARGRSWYPAFYNALPEYNGMKMKSGTIKDVKAFCGYHRAKDGKEYIFSFLVNNYNGSASVLVKKMYTVLDVLK